MSCETTLSTFSASSAAAAALNIRKGWRGRVAGQLHDARRLVGRVGSAAATEPSLNTHRGRHSFFVDNCTGGCTAYGSTYSQATDGKRKTRALIGAGDGVCGPCNIILPTQLRLTGFADPCGYANWLGSHNGQTLDFPMSGCYTALTFGGGGLIGLGVRVYPPGSVPGPVPAVGDLVFSTAANEFPNFNFGIIFQNVIDFDSCTPLAGLIGTWNWQSADVYIGGLGNPDPTLPAACWGSVELIA